MQASVQALLAGIIDYAGLFPPARLPLETAFRNYARYRTEPESWMLGRFICPATDLEALTPFQDLWQAKPPFVFSALGRGGTTRGQWLDGLRADLEAIAHFRERHEAQVVVDVLEVKAPFELAGNREAFHALLEDMRDLIDTRGPPRLTPFLEITPNTLQIETLHVSLAAMAEFNAGLGSQRCGPVGLKLRCGGLEASAFPSVEQVAQTMIACRDHRVALKATAGLHHPLRRFDEALQATMHGFVNVFGAGVLAHSQRLNQQDVAAILQDDQAQDFIFSSEGMSWKSYCAATATIRSVREQALISFGSCSFDEPREDLRHLGWLP